MSFKPRSASSVLALLIALVPVAAQAIEPPQCPTFFPDFRCERSGRYDGFVMPMNDPFIFEDPFITTGLYAWGLWHEFPNESAFGGGQLVSADGGDVWAGAVQARVAITDRLAFIATKDGYAFFDVHAKGLLDDTDGFMNISAGFKYALVDMREDNFILSPSVRIEAPVGQNQVFQGYGDGEIIPALSAAWGIGNFHAIADVGGQIPFSTKKQSTSIFYHLHMDYALHEHFVPLVAFSGQHWTDSGRGTLSVVDTRLGYDPTLTEAQALLGTGPFEGLDVINLGSRKVARNDILRFGVGARFPITKHVSLGGLYEFPLTNRQDIEEQRVWMSLTLEY